MAVRPPAAVVKPVVAGVSGALDATVPLPTSMLLDLFKATHTQSLAVAVRRIACEWLGAAGADVYLLSADERTRELDPDAQRLMRRVVETNTHVVETGSVSTHTAQVAAPLHVQGLLTGVLIATLPIAVWEREESRARWTHLLQLLELRLDQLRTLKDMQQSVTHLEEAERLQRALFAIAEQASADRDMPDVFRSLHEIVGSLMYAENFYIVLFDPVRETLRFAYFVDIADTDPPDTSEDVAMRDRVGSLTWHLLKRGSAMRGTLQQIEAEVGTIVNFGPDCVDWLGVPLLRGGKIVGGIVVQSYTEAARYTDRDQALLTYVAQHIQTALERRSVHEELERRVAERTDALREANRLLQQQVLERQRGERLQAALFRIAELANSTESLEEFYAAVHRAVGGLLYARNFYIALLTEDREHLAFPYSVDERDEKRAPRKLGTGLTEYVLRTGSALLADRAGLERLYLSGAAQPIGTRSRSWLGVPLICADRTVGVLVVQSHSDEHRYTPRDQELLTFVSYHIANALERKRNAESLKEAYAELEVRVIERTSELAAANRELREHIGVRERMERQLKHETLHDALTGLPNRNFLLDRLTQALAQFQRDPHERFAVLFLDLDRFKIINDSVGHLVGDELLNEVGGRISACLEPRDLVARLGGDEFAILLHDIQSIEDACAQAQRIIDALNAPIRLGGKEVFTSTSIGIAISSSRYRKAEELLRDADVAMYRAKDDGRHRYAVFDEHLHKRAMQLLELESDLRHALTRNEFMPYFQPIVRLCDQVVVGYEALLRWLHPQRGVLTPGDFLSVAEESGAAELIDWQMFDRVLEIAPPLLEGGKFIGINLSGRHFRSETLDEKLLALLRQHNIRPESLRLEVTERMLIENPPAAKRTLESLRTQGLAVSLDDFGTGYSSLSYLHQFPVQALKIDRSFIADLVGDGSGGSAAVVRAILALAGALGMQVIAEGIETQEQHDALVQLGCTFGQGFFYARPQPASVWIGHPATV